MAAALESFTEVCGCRALVRRAGSGEPLLFLHGAGGLPGWPPFLARLADQFEVLAPDHPSFGRSPTPPWLDDIGDLAYYYLEFLKAHRLDGVHVVGHSLGGWIALEMAIRATQRIKSLTLIAPAGIRVKGRAPTDVFVLDRAELTRVLYADPAIVERELAVIYTPEEEERIINNRVAAARLSWQPRLFNPKLAKWLHRIDVPTHIVWGEADRLIPPAYAPALKALIPGSTVAMIADAGHLPHIERAEVTGDAVLGFLSR